MAQNATRITARAIKPYTATLVRLGRADDPSTRPSSSAIQRRTLSTRRSSHVGPAMLRNSGRARIARSGARAADTSAGGFWYADACDRATRSRARIAARVAGSGCRSHVSRSLRSQIAEIVHVRPGAVTTLAGDPTQTGSTDGVGGAARFDYPTGVAVDQAGNLFVVDQNNATIRMLKPVVSGNGTTWDVSTIAGIPGTQGHDDGPLGTATFYSPYGIAVDANGNVYVSDPGNHTIRLLTPSTVNNATTWTVSTLAGKGVDGGFHDGPGASATFSAPMGLALDNGGNLYVADADNQAIRMLSPTTQGTNTTWMVSRLVIAGEDLSSPTMAYPTAVAADGFGRLYVADQSNGAIFMLAPAASGINWVQTGVVGSSGHNSMVISGPLPGGLFNPTGIALDPTTGNLIVTVPAAVMKVQ